MCGCGSSDGGCGSHASPAPAPATNDAPAAIAGVQPQVAVAADPAADAGAPRLIASSEQEWPRLFVNSMPIRPEAIAQEMQYHPAASREEALYDACRALVLRELLQQRVLALGITATPGPGESQEEAAIEALIAREVTLPAIGEDELRRVYEANRERFVTAPLVAARHILLAAAPDDPEERSRQRDEALALLARLQDGADFAALARTHSVCPSSAQGGELGQISRGQTVPEFERQLFRLPVGLAAQPLESRYGFHVVELQHRVDGRALPFEAVAESIRQDLAQRGWQKAVAHYLQALVAEADIEGMAFNEAGSPLLQ